MGKTSDTKMQIINMICMDIMKEYMTHDPLKNPIDRVEKILDGIELDNKMRSIIIYKIAYAISTYALKCVDEEIRGIQDKKEIAH